MLLLGRKPLVALLLLEVKLFVIMLASYAVAGTRAASGNRAAAGSEAA